MLVAWEILGLTESNPDEKITGQRNIYYDFSLYTLHLACHHLLTLFSELALTISIFMHCTYPDIQISVRELWGHRRVWKTEPNDPKLDVKKCILLVAAFLPTPAIRNLIN